MYVKGLGIMFIFVPVYSSSILLTLLESKDIHWKMPRQVRKEFRWTRKPGNELVKVAVGPGKVTA